MQLKQHGNHVLYPNGIVKALSVAVISLYDTSQRKRAVLSGQTDLGQLAQREAAYLLNSVDTRLETFCKRVFPAFGRDDKFLAVIPGKHGVFCHPGRKLFSVIPGRRTGIEFSLRLPG